MRSKRALWWPLAGLTLLVGVSLHGCSGPLGASTTAPAPPTADAAPASAVTPNSVPVPTFVSVPDINTQSDLLPLGVNPDHTVQVPDMDHPEHAGWVREVNPPTGTTPYVILGHIDGGGQQGVFYRLALTHLGSKITVDFVGGATATYTVYRTELVPKAAFPAQAVYGPAPGPELRLVSCGGPYNPAARSYTDNVIIFAARDAAPS